MQSAGATQARLFTRIIYEPWSCSVIDPRLSQKNQPEKAGFFRMLPGNDDPRSGQGTACLPPAKNKTRFPGFYR